MSLLIGLYGARLELSRLCPFSMQQELILAVCFVTHLGMEYLFSGILILIKLGAHQLCPEELLSKIQKRRF